MDIDPRVRKAMLKGADAGHQFSCFQYRYGDEVRYVESMNWQGFNVGDRLSCRWSILLVSRSHQATWVVIILALESSAGRQADC